MTDKRTVVLLGIGHTNAHIVHQWASQPPPNCRLVCISRFPFATYSGMLPGTLARQFQRQEMQVDLQSLVDSAKGELVLADTDRLDRESQTIHFIDHEPIRYDLLSIGVGSMPAGATLVESPKVVPIKPMQTFIERLTSVLSHIDMINTDVTKIAVVGGGVAGVEIALCLRGRFKDLTPKRPVQIHILTRSDRIADGLRPGSVSKLHRILDRNDIQIHVKQTVGDATDPEIRKRQIAAMPYDCIVWATGAEAPPVIAKLGLKTDNRGFVATKDTLQAISDDKIFAVGDSGTVIASPSPKAGVYAVRQCPILWHNLNAMLANKPLIPFKPQKDFLKLLNTGDGKALLEYKFISAYGRWCLKLKNWIDKRFITEYQKQSH